MNMVTHVTLCDMNHRAHSQGIASATSHVELWEVGVAIRHASRQLPKYHEIDKSKVMHVVYR